MYVPWKKPTYGNAIQVIGFIVRVILTVIRILVTRSIASVIIVGMAYVYQIFKRRVGLGYKQATSVY